MRIWMAALALLLVPGIAHAEWLEASSAHFVVYADDSDHDVRMFSEQLERFHGAMQAVAGMTEDVPPSPSNRVMVFVVKNPREIQKLAGTRDIYGFYIPRAGSSVAFVPRVTVKTGEPDFSMIALLHEYAHHFLISHSSFPGPRWYGEGAAEFFASAEFSRDGSVSIGKPAYHRAWELALAPDVKVEELVDPDLYEKKARRTGSDAFYGKSWLLYHYLVFTPERSGQLHGYIEAMARGKSSREAAEEVFGDLDQLERDLERYIKRRTISSLQFKPGAFPIPPITVRRISEGDAAMMPVRVQSRRGVDTEQAAAVLADAREIAARFPGDPAVLSALAEAEFDGGNDAEAIADADAALALDPKQVNAYIQKGYALFRRASAADDPVAAYKKAVAPFLALNKIENDHPLPLVYYFFSFAQSGREPPEAAVQGLERAVELAPFDLGLRLNLAIYQIQSSKFAQARANLIPIAYNPHGGGAAETARRAIERIDAGGDLQPPELMAIFGDAGEAVEGAE